MCLFVLIKWSVPELFYGNVMYSCPVRVYTPLCKPQFSMTSWRGGRSAKSDLIHRSSVCDKL